MHTSRKSTAPIRTIQTIVRRPLAPFKYILATVATPTGTEAPGVSRRRSKDVSGKWLAYTGSALSGGNPLNYLHKSAHLSRGDVVIFTVSHQCNVRIMTDLNYNSYRSGRTYNFHGGRAVKSPIRITVPSSGRWNAVIDLGGAAGTVRGNIAFLRMP